MRSVSARPRSSWTFSTPVSSPERRSCLSARTASPRNSSSTPRPCCALLAEQVFLSCPVASSLGSPEWRRAGLGGRASGRSGRHRSGPSPRIACGAAFPPGFRPRPWPVSWGTFVVPLAAVGNACALGVVVLALSAAATILVRLPRALSVAMRAVGVCAHCGRPLETCPPAHARPPGALGAWPGFVRAMWREAGVPLVAAARWHPHRPYRLGDIAQFALRVLVLGALAAAITLASFAVLWEPTDAIDPNLWDTGSSCAR